MRLPIVKSLHIENFTGTAITNADYFNKNAIIGEYDDSRIYATQRPSIDIFDDASVNALPEKGRGVYFWEHPNVNDRYIIIDDTVYKESTATPMVVAATLSGGTDKVYFIEMVNYLVIIDPENNEGWYIDQAADETLVQIIDDHFPGQLSNSDELTAGGVFLDGRIYVGGISGAIYGSDSGTPIDWDPLNKVSAEREADKGIYLDKIVDHVVMFGSRTIEFFYNAANTTASPLSRRRDIFHNIGMMQGDAAWREGDDLHFVAVYPSGPLEVMKMNAQFQLENISTPEVESYITNARLVEDSSFISSGFTAGHRTFYIITFYRIVMGVIQSTVSLAFDGISWGIWESALCDCNKFPLIGWTIRSGSDARSGEGILSNGDLLTITDDFVPVDTLLATAYIEDGYIQDGYHTQTGGTGENIEMIVRTGPFDGETNHWKFGHTMEVVGDETENSLTATIKWANGNSLDFNTGRTINLSKKQKITRLGRFKRRNHEVVFDITEQYRIEALELELTEGGH